MFIEDFAEREMRELVEAGEKLNIAIAKDLITKWLEEECTKAEAIDHFLSYMAEIDGESLVSAFCASIRTCNEGSFGFFVVPTMVGKFYDIMLSKYDEIKNESPDDSAECASGIIDRQNAAACGGL